MNRVINMKNVEAENAKRTLINTAVLFALHEVVMELSYVLGSLDPKGGSLSEHELSAAAQAVGNGNAFILSVLCRTYGQKLSNVGRHLQELTESLEPGEAHELTDKINRTLEEYGNTHETIVSKYLSVIFDEMQAQANTTGEGSHE